MFVLRIARAARIECKVSSDNVITYFVKGPLFFASSDRVFERFEFSKDLKGVIIDLSEAEIYDPSVDVTIGDIKNRYEKLGVPVNLIEQCNSFRQDI